MSNEYKWLQHFVELFHPSESFLTAMHEALMNEYEEIMDHAFDLEYLFVEFKSDLEVDDDSNLSKLICIPIKKVHYQKEPSIIVWQAGDKSKVILPTDDIEPDQVIFKWEKLIMIAQEAQAQTVGKATFVEELGMDFPFPITTAGNMDTQDLVVKIKVKHIDQYPLFIPKLEKFQEKYNELLGDKGLIHSVSEIKFYNATIEFHINAGSAHPLRVFRALLFILLDIDTNNDRCIEEIAIESK